MYLLDTNVVSELRLAATGRANTRVVAWASSVPTRQLYISSITLLELEIGVQRIERRDPVQGQQLRTWLSEQVVPAFKNRILAFDEVAAQVCASYHVPDPKPDRDSFIAAIAEAHGMVLVTRNEKDFAGIGIDLINPWIESRGG